MNSDPTILILGCLRFSIEVAPVSALKEITVKSDGAKVLMHEPFHTKVPARSPGHKSCLLFI